MPVFFIRNPQIHVIGLGLDGLDGLYHIQDVRIVGECTVPERW